VIGPGTGMLTGFPAIHRGFDGSGSSPCPSVPIEVAHELPATAVWQRFRGVVDLTPRNRFHHLAPPARRAARPVAGRTSRSGRRHMHACHPYNDPARPAARPRQHRKTRRTGRPHVLAGPEPPLTLEMSQGN
jgi:hypothetical protein